MIECSKKCGHETFHTEGFVQKTVVLGNRGRGRPFIMSLGAEKFVDIVDPKTFVCAGCGSPAKDVDLAFTIKASDLLYGLTPSLLDKGEPIIQIEWQDFGKKGKTRKVCTSLEWAIELHKKLGELIEEGKKIPVEPLESINLDWLDRAVKNSLGEKATAEPLPVENLNWLDKEDERIMRNAEE